MIKQKTDLPAPDGYSHVITIGDETEYYFIGEDVDNEFRLDINKREKLLKIKTALRTNIDGGYTSSATGEELSYSLDSEDMNDLSGLIDLGNVSGKYRAGNSKRFISHTLQQLKQVRDEGVSYKYAAYEKLEALQDQINVATTAEEIEAIKW